MRYLMAILGDETAMQQRPDEAMQQMIAAFESYTKAMNKAGVRITGYALQPSAEGVRVRIRDGRREVIDGPFTETKEVLGGFYVIEVASQAEAIEWAAQCPSAPFGTLELRPIVDLPY